MRTGLEQAQRLSYLEFTWRSKNNLSHLQSKYRMDNLLIYSNQQRSNIVQLKLKNCSVTHKFSPGSKISNDTFAAEGQIGLTLLMKETQQTSMIYCFTLLISHKCPLESGHCSKVDSEWLQHVGIHGVTSISVLTWSRRAPVHSSNQVGWLLVRSSPRGSLPGQRLRTLLLQA